ncbi:hypothetical protein HYH08_12255 [Bradyrhizobium sp. BR 10289]|nr:hypothetical protein [Bradyrhizobium sp. BR 10289]
MQAHGFWTAKNDEVPRLFVLVSYAEGDDPVEIEKRYLRSPELAEDVEGFDVGNIVRVETTMLLPSTASPLM